MDTPKRGRGRPPGSKNKTKTMLSIAKAELVERVKPASMPDASITKSSRLPDMSDMIGSQLRIIEATQCQVALEIAAGGCPVKKVADLSNALARAIDAVARASKAQDSILARLSNTQHVEAAIRRLEDQEASVINYAVRRLKKAVVGETEVRVMATASDAIRELND